LIVEEHCLDTCEGRNEANLRGNTVCLFIQSLVLTIRCIVLEVDVDRKIYSDFGRGGSPRMVHFLHHLDFSSILGRLEKLKNLSE
jgi:hypothetical protein